ncbi:MAG: glycosyl-4,4'-diaponeurosporenoate acyltransferase [Bacilli bacterium]
MQIFFFNPVVTLIIAFLLWFLLQSGSAYICLKLNDKYYQSQNFIFKIRAWEQNGFIYERIFHVRRWKKFLPDGSKVVKGGYQKSHLHDFSEENLHRFIIESARAELTHWLAIIPFWVFGLFMPLYAVFIMLLYALIVNLPCIIAQRYNRPRVIHLMNKKYHNKSIT